MGRDDGLPERLSPEDEKRFPNLAATGYRVTSEKDSRYNCIAFAAGDENRKWDPAGLPLPGYYWPSGADRGSGPESLKSAFEAIGFELCANGELESGFEKVAIYVDSDDCWSHAARQLESGEWCSKLGNEEDIRHRTATCFGGSIYGDVIYYMRLRIAT